MANLSRSVASVGKALLTPFVRMGNLTTSIRGVYRDLVISMPYGVTDHPESERPLYHGSIDVGNNPGFVPAAMIGKSDDVANKDAPDLAIQWASFQIIQNGFGLPIIIFTPENSHDPIAVGSTFTVPVVFPRTVGGFNRTWVFGGYNAAVNPRGGVVFEGRFQTTTGVSPVIFPGPTQVIYWNPPLIIPGGTFLAISGTATTQGLRVGFAYRELEGRGRRR